MQGVRGSSPRSSTIARDEGSMRKPSPTARRLAGMNLPFCLLPVAFVVLIAACSSAPAATVAPTATATATPSATPSAQAPAVRPTGSLTSRPGSLTADYSGILSMDAIEGGCAYLQTTDGRKRQVLSPAAGPPPGRLAAAEGPSPARRPRRHRPQQRWRPGLGERLGGDGRRDDLPDRAGHPGHRGRRQLAAPHGDAADGYD